MGTVSLKFASRWIYCFISYYLLPATPSIELCKFRILVLQHTSECQNFFLLRYLKLVVIFWPIHTISLKFKPYVLFSRFYLKELQKSIHQYIGTNFNYNYDCDNRTLFICCLFYSFLILSQLAIWVVPNKLLFIRSTIIIFV